ncbi:uncharacterized protein BJX67DRAFT_387559 [Aspergillus lucknowensis]|uniref:Fe2OG dioxygenase domain-containing protein n=1 Tax=Aspergillus lucknowensis TaxID=176173 RepID=A0ABR4LTR9_9EURO
MATVGTLTSTPIPDPMVRPDFDPVNAIGSPITLENVSFDPSKHLNFTHPTKVHSMEELGYSKGRGVSPVGVTEPFPLFSAEAIQQMRKEVLSDEVFSKWNYSSELAQCQLRGYAADCAPFVYDAWKNPETLGIISKIAGIDLVPAMDFEIGHINLAVYSEEEKNKALNEMIDKAARATRERGSSCPLEDNDPIVDWHTDSYPFVCVTMLSDCTGMIGGETALRRGDGQVIKVRGPQMGYAVVLQGRYIEHQALRALGGTERITMVTSFRPRASLIKDDTVLTTVRPISDLGELYLQFAEYRFDMLQDRFRHANKLMRDQQRARRPFDTVRLKQFIREQIEFLEHMDKEMVEDSKVVKGVPDEGYLNSEDLKLERLKKRRVAVA